MAQQLSFQITPIEGLLINAELNYRIENYHRHRDWQTVYAYNVDNEPYVDINNTTTVYEQNSKSNFFAPSFFADTASPSRIITSRLWPVSRVNGILHAVCGHSATVLWQVFLPWIRPILTHVWVVTIRSGQLPVSSAVWTTTTRAVTGDKTDLTSSNVYQNPGWPLIDGQAPTGYWFWWRINCFINYTMERGSWESPFPLISTQCWQPNGYFRWLAWTMERFTCESWMMRLSYRNEKITTQDEDNLRKRCNFIILAQIIRR